MLQIICLITQNIFKLKISTLSKQNEQFQQMMKNQICKQNEQFLLAAKNYTDILKQVQNQQKINKEVKSGSLY